MSVYFFFLGAFSTMKNTTNMIAYTI